MVAKKGILVAIQIVKITKSGSKNKKKRKTKNEVSKRNKTMVITISEVVR